MAEGESIIATKRKASPESALENVADKRARLEPEDQSAPSINAITGGAEEGPEGPPPAKREEDGQPAERAPPQPRWEAEPQPQHPPDQRRPSATSGPPIRRNVSVEEKKRGQRLFGGLVSTLSRTTSGSQQQRRLEIERRQQEKAQQRRAEDEKRRAERLEQLKKTRQIEQIKLDERAMQTRHRTMLSKARSLQTTSEPRLYYLPWELTKEQEDIISDQIRTAEETVDRERRDFRLRKEQRLRALGVTPPPRSPSPPAREQNEQPKTELETNPPSEEATVGEPIPPPQVTNPDAAAPTPPKERPHHHDKDHDEHGDEMVQDEEDVVIY